MRVDGEFLYIKSFLIVWTCWKSQEELNDEKNHFEGENSGREEQEKSGNFRDASFVLAMFRSR